MPTRKTIRSKRNLMSPVPHLVHRYPDRVLLMVTNQCRSIAASVMRKRLVGKTGIPERESRPGHCLLARTPGSTGRHSVRRRPPAAADHLFGADSQITPYDPPFEVIRIGTRVPGSLPERITPKLCEIIKSIIRSI